MTIVSRPFTTATESPATGPLRIAAVASESIRCASCARVAFCACALDTASASASADVFTTNREATTGESIIVSDPVDLRIGWRQFADLASETGARSRQDGAVA